MRISPLDSSNINGFAAKETAIRVAECPSGNAMRQQKVLGFGSRELTKMGSDFTSQLLEAGVRTLCCFPLICRNNPIGALCIAGKKDNAFAAEAIELMSQVTPQLAAALDNSRAYSEIASLKDRLVKSGKGYSGLSSGMENWDSVPLSP
jgi:GAF domain-containing protein